METEITEISESEFSEHKAGDFVKFSKSGIDIKTGAGILRITKVKPEGKGEMQAYDWANGLHLK